MPPVAEGFDAPQDHDGDGFFEDVRGTGEPVGIEDVQALFEHRHSDAVQENAWAYNFSGTNSERVTVFDVQALFSRIGE